MSIRPKLLILLIGLGFVPVLVLGGYLYWQALKRVETELRTGAMRDADQIALNIDSELREVETSLVSLARSPAVRSYVRNGNRPSTVTVKQAANDVGNKTGSDTDQTLPDSVREAVRAFVASAPNRYVSVIVLSTSGTPLLKAEPVIRDANAGNKAAIVDVDYSTENFSGRTSSADPRVWNTTDQTPLRSPLVNDSTGAVLRLSVPVFVRDAGQTSARGVLIAELKGNQLFADIDPADRSDTNANAANLSDSTALTRFLIILGHDGDVLYHTNEVFRHQRVEAVMPAFKDVSSAMIREESGLRFFDKGGSKWLVAFRPVSGLPAFVGVARDYTGATRPVKRIGWISLAILLAVGVVTALVLAHFLNATTRGIKRVTEGAVAIAGGRLEQRIEILSNDETSLLAESFNVMTDRLREQIARETETRQFESFMRLSAMMTHDLKNAIAGLSLLVGNMERQFHREEFRTDAMEALTGAADKLRKLVSKLSEPVQSLSSEHKRAQPIDIVPIIKNALVTTVELAGEKHEIDVHLPESLVAKVEADRIEKVFENLIINALEAMGSKSGKLSVEAGTTAAGEVFVSFSDTGPGMSEEFQRVKLFRPFATTKKNGIGLGLYTCREIVQAHGGRIEVTSQRGSGATFRAVLPSQSTTITGK